MKQPKGIMTHEGTSLLTLIVLNVGALVVLRWCLTAF